MVDKNEVLRAIREKDGLVATALDSVGATWSQHKEWLKNDPEYKGTIEFIQELVKDDIERSAMSAVKSKNAQVITHMLKTKLSDRGYTAEESLSIIGDTIDIGWDEDEA